MNSKLLSKKITKDK